MRVTVFGATGETGKQLVEQALASGKEVVAYVRNQSKLCIVHEHLSIVQGELSNLALIEHAITGADAVISTLGPRGDSKKQTSYSRSAKHHCGHEKAGCPQANNNFNLKR